ncbi:MAG: hypothetical protein R3C44_04205 [Chloroflexota bacterium]
MIRTQVQTAEYWKSEFALTDSDLENIYNHFLETEKPQTVEALARMVIEQRVRAQLSDVKRLLSDATVYQPQRNFEIGEEIVFPALKLAKGKVTAIRPGYNPEYGNFDVIAVELKGKEREFAANLQVPHILSEGDSETLTEELAENVDTVVDQFLPQVSEKISESLSQRDDFIRQGSEWFVTSLMSDVNIGHLHLAEAILEINDGGPLTTAEILPQLELDPGVDESIQAFSLNHAMMQDGRFDEVSPTRHLRWFLKRMEPEGVQTTPERLVYEPIAFDKALLAPPQLALIQELDDEWSDLPDAPLTDPVVWPLSFPHRWAGTLPLNGRIRPLIASTDSPRQRITLIDDETQQELPGWVVTEGRYIYGLSDWYAENSIPVGGYLHLRPGPQPGSLFIGYDRRRAQREWVRLASIADNRIQFELLRRAIPCGYDDLLIVGTDVLAAIDAHWRRAESGKRSIASLLAELFPPLAALSPQNTVHAKTLYSAINMLKRLPPGPLFAELVRLPAFQAVGDDYWQFDSEQMRS